MSLFARGGALVLLPMLMAAQPCSGAELLELYRATMKSNPLLIARDYNVQRGEAIEDQARSRLRPQLTAQADYSWNEFDAKGVSAQGYSGNREVIQGRQSIFDVASHHRLQSAKARTSQNRQELESARMQVTAELVSRYLDALAALDELGYLEADRAAAVSQLARLRRLHEMQMAKIPDLYETEAYVEDLRAREITARNTLAVSLERLREISGAEVTAVTPLRSLRLPGMGSSLGEWVEAAANNNPDLAGLKYAIDAERRMLASTRAEQLPRLSIVGTGIHSDLGFDNRSNPPFNVGSIGLQLSLSLYEGGRVQAASREALARHQIAVQQYEESRRGIEREIRVDFLDIVAGEARMEAAAQSVRAQEKAHDAQQRSYELGATTIVDVLDARRRLLRARTDASKARLDYVRAQIALKMHAGALGEADIGEIGSGGMP